MKPWRPAISKSFQTRFWGWLIWSVPVIPGLALFIIHYFWDKNFEWTEVALAFTLSLVISVFFQVGRIVFRLDDVAFLKEAFRSHIEMVDQAGIRNIYPSWSNCKEVFYKKLCLR